MTTSLINTTTIVRALRGELFLKREAWQAASLDHLLEQFPAALLIMSADSGVILAVNSSLIKLTEWTRADLVGQVISQIIVPPEVVAQMVSLRPGSSKLLQAVSWRTHSGGTIVMDQKLSAFAEDRRGETLLLAQVTPTQDRLAHEQEEAQAAQVRARIEEIAGLLSTATPQSLQAAVRITREAFSAETAGIYETTTAPRGLRLEWAEGQTSVLPPKLGPSELQFMNQPLSWNHSQRPEAMLCQVARANGWSHVLSMPIGDAPDIQGALFVSYRHGNPPPAVVTAKHLGAAAQQVGHLMKQILREVKLGDAQRLAVRLSSQMAAINAQVEEGIVILTGEGTIDEINPAAAQMLGYRSEDVSGLSYTDIVIADAHIMDAILASTSGIASASLRGNIFRRGGQPFPATVRIQPLPECGCVITLHDESEEEASRARREHLDSLAYLGQSTQAFAHEVRGPLNNISLGLQYLQSRLKDADDTLREALSKILTEGNRLSTLMNEMLAWAKPVEPHLEALDLKPLLERLLSRWHSKIVQRNVHVTLVTDDNCPPALADAIHLERIFVNLIDNALQAMPAGGDLSIRIEAPEAAAPSTQREVLIRVGDTGPGMPEDVRRRVFDPYFTTKPNGTGLGLAICRRLVTVNRGAISVESFPGTGTIFTVTLPACQASEAPGGGKA